MTPLARSLLVAAVAGLIGIGAGYAVRGARSGAGPATPGPGPVASTPAAVVDALSRRLDCWRDAEAPAEELPLVRMTDGARLNVAELPPDLLADYVAMTKGTFNRLDAMLRTLDLRKQITQKRRPDWKEGTPLPTLEQLFAEDAKVPDEDVRKAYEQEKGRYGDDFAAVEATIRETVRIRRLQLAMAQASQDPEMVARNDYASIGPCMPRIAGGPALAKGGKTRVVLVGDFFCARCRDVWREMAAAAGPDLALDVLISPAPTEIAFDAQQRADLCTRDLTADQRRAAMTALFEVSATLPRTARDFRRAFREKGLAGLDTATQDRLDQCLIGQERAEELRAERIWVEANGLQAAPAILVNERPLVPSPSPSSLKVLLGLLTKPR